MHIFTVLPLKLKQPSEYLMSKSLWSIYLVAFFYLSVACNPLELELESPVKVLVAFLLRVIRVISDW